MQLISTQVRRAAATLFGGLLLAHAGHVLADVSPLSVSGNRVLAGGQPASFAGNSLFWSNTGWAARSSTTPAPSAG